MLYAADPRYGIKESQGLARIAETFVCAVEFITLPTPPVRVGMSGGREGWWFVPGA